MMKYTKEDVIIWADDSKLEDAIGKDVYTGFSALECLDNANNDKWLVKLSDIDDTRKTPFYVLDKNISPSGEYVNCIILKKEPVKKIVPFDFSLKEDRDALMGKRIRTDACDMVVTTFAYWLAHGWQIQIDSENGFSGKYVLENFVFADGSNEGKPVGKEIEV